MPLPRAGAGCSPRRARHFSLLRQRKVPKRKATPSLRPLRCATGQTCGGALAGCAVELALLLRSAARTATASQITKHGRTGAHATPQPPRRRRSQQGVNTPTAIRVVAALDPKKAAPCARRLRPQQRAERSNGPRGGLAVWLPHPLCMRRGAQRPADQGSRLSERSAAQRVRARPRWTRAPQVARSEAQGRRQWGRLFFGDFLLAKQKKVTAPPGAHPGQPPSNTAPKNHQGSSLFTSGSAPPRGPTVPSRALSDCGCPVISTA